MDTKPTLPPTCLHIDSVICDSEPEVSTSALEAAEAHWPNLFSGLSSSERERVRAGLKAVRPRLIAGWESMVMARLVLESDANVGAVLASWPSPLLPDALAAWGDDAASISAAFEAQRGRIMATDAWLHLNKLYPGVKEALEASPFPYYIASSKKASRLVSLLNLHLNLGIDEQSPRLFASLQPPKLDALREIAARPIVAQNPGITMHFVDDRCAVRGGGKCAVGVGWLGEGWCRQVLSVDI
jgi:hypothetical protein